MTFISRMEASVSTDMEVSQLPLREKPPPSDAKVAADRVDAVLEPYKRNPQSDQSNQMEPNSLQHVTASLSEHGV